MKKKDPEKNGYGMKTIKLLLGVCYGGWGWGMDISVFSSTAKGEMVG